MKPPLPRPSPPIGACQHCGKAHLGLCAWAPTPTVAVADDVAREREKHRGGPRVLR